MAKKKKNDILEGAGANPAALLVQKSNPLVSLWQSELTLQEFKILDVYLSRINSENPEQKIVRFRKGELEELLGVTKINMVDLEKRLKHLMGNVIRIDDDKKEKGFKMVTLFEEAAAWQDKNGLWTVDLQCTNSAMEYFFNIKNIGYFMYRLRCVMPLQSRYAYILFLYLESQRFRNPIVIEVDELKRLLSCDEELNYKEFYRFRQKVIDRALKELHEKTEFRCSYETIKNGRRVTAIKFVLETLPEIALPEDRDQVSISDYINSADEREPFWIFGPLPWLSDSQGDEVRLLSAQLGESKLPYNISRDLQIYDYLSMKQAKLTQAKERAAEKGKPIKNEYAYLISMIKNDIEG